MVRWYLAVLAAVAAERGFEMMISRRHAAHAFARGGIELGQRHFILMKVLHVSFLLGCAAEVIWLQRPFIPALGAAMAGLIVLSEALRYWAIVTLGARWNIRVIVVPGEPVITSGPYRYLRHPNYVAVIIEGLAIPLLHTAWITASVFTALNALLLAVRISCEEQALAHHCGYWERLGTRGRLLPLSGAGHA